MSPVLDLPLTVAPTAEAREIDGNFTIYDKQHDRVTVLNDSASAIWRLCDGRSGQAIIDELARRYVGDSAQIKEEVVGVLQRLTSMGLLLDSNPPHDRLLHG
jgi:hypothetical protein